MKTAITPLQAALNALQGTDSKYAHLSPSMRDALRERVEYLEYTLGIVDARLEFYETVVPPIGELE